MSLGIDSWLKKESEVFAKLTSTDDCINGAGFAESQWHWR